MTATADLSLTRFRFGRFELIPPERRLLVDGVPATVTAKAFDLLVALAERAGRLVTKDELLDVVWPNLVVEEGNLAVQVSALRKIIGPEAIATIPGRGYRFTHLGQTPDVSGADAAADIADGVPAALVHSNVPGLPSRLFGRDDDVAALMHLLEHHRLVTITGPGGIGKTRLAQAVAITRQESYQHGAAWVELAPLTNPDLVASAIATAMRIPLGSAGDPITALASALRPLSLLIVIDNAEQVIERVRKIADAVIEETSGVRLLLTSQLPLKSAHERVYRLGALEVPDAQVGAQQALDYGAVALFADRAAAVDRRFVLNDDNVASVIDICRRLDGVALGIELAAARVPLLGAQGVAQHLDQRFRLLVSRDRLAPSRQQTLLAAFEWSHGLLSEQQQTVFRRLGVFAGGFSLELARAVVTDEELDEWTVIDLLGDLIDRSLVAATSGDAPRYYLLETGRVYALERLTGAGEIDSMRMRHANAVRAEFERAFEDYWVMSDAAYRQRYEPELGNLRAAFGWSLQHDHAGAVALASTSDPLLLLLSLLVEARQYSDAALGLIEAEPPPKSMAARFWCSRAAVFADRPDRLSRNAAQQALEMYRELADARGTYLCLHYLAYSYRNSKSDASAALAEMRQLENPDWPPRLRLFRMAIESTIAVNTGRKTEARTLLEEEMRLAVATGADDMVAACLGSLAAILLSTGDIAGAIAMAKELVDRCRQQRNIRRLSIALSILLNAMLAGDAASDARQVAEEFVAVDRRLGWSYLHRAADALALLAGIEGRMAVAARIAGFSDSAYAAQTNYRKREWGLEASRSRIWLMLQQALEPGALAALMAEGGNLTADQVCALALQSQADAPPVSARPN